MNEPSLERLRRNMQRMKVLKALNLLVGVDRETDFETLLNACDIMNAPMVESQLDYHLRLMNAKGWVILRIERTQRRVDDIVGIKLTPKGVDRIDLGKMPELEG